MKWQDMGDDGYVSDLKEDHEELYGLLLLANQKISNVGTSSIWVMAIIVLAICVSLHMRWVTDIAGIPVDDFRSVGVYVLISVSTFYLYTVVTNFQERAVYLQIKPEIEIYLQRYHLSYYNLLSQIQDDDDLNDIATKIKDDPDIQPRAD